MLVSKVVLTEVFHFPSGDSVLLKKRQKMMSLESTVLPNYANLTLVSPYCPHLVFLLEADSCLGINNSFLHSQVACAQLV